MIRNLFIILFVLTIAGPAFAQAWPTNWRSTGNQAVSATTAGGRPNAVSNNNGVVIGAPLTIDGDNNAPQLRLKGTRGHTICLSTDSGAAGNGTGGLTVEVLWFGVYDETNINYFVELAILTSGAPCVYDVPQGELILRAGADATTNGLVVVRANK